MVDHNSDFFQIVDNFAKIAHIPSIPVIESKIDFVPKITIAIPTYKRTDLLKEALDSAINQVDFDDYEIIVVDNDPKRGCNTEIMMLSYQCSRLSYYKNYENIGMFANWNRCITLAKGEYLTILNDDDLLSNEYLSTVINFKNKFKKIDALLVGYNIIDENKLLKINKKYKAEKLNKYKKINSINFLFGNINPGSLGVCFKKESIQSIGGFDDLYYPISDYVFYLNYVDRFKNVYYLSNRLAFYRLLKNESLKTNIQVENIKLGKLLRIQFTKKYKQNRYIFRLAIPMFDYVHLKEVCLYSEEFKKLYSTELVEAKRKINLFNRLTYYILLIIKKVQNQMHNID